MARLADGNAPLPSLQELWRDVLFYQFHDILPGTAIRRVYEECLPHYQRMQERLEEIADKALEPVAARIDCAELRHPLLIWNDASWQREEWVEVDGGWRRMNLPALGWQVLDAAEPPSALPELHASPELLRNAAIEVALNQHGFITQVIDRGSGRHWIPPGEQGNLLQVYHDSGDPWDFAHDYQRRLLGLARRTQVKAFREGPRAILRQVFACGEHSQLEQDVVLTGDSPVVEFITRIDWQDRRTMLRSSFPIAVNTLHAVCGIPYGYILRPTHENRAEDYAMSDVGVQGWADLSDVGGGCALLAEDRYGFRVKNNVLDLNLLRSVAQHNKLFVSAHHPPTDAGEPAGWTDLGESEVRYALLPHAGNHVQGGVAQAAMHLGTPLRVRTLKPRRGDLPRRLSVATLSDPQVLITACKPSEDGGDVILRLHESSGSPRSTEIELAWPVASCQRCNLLEEPEEEVPVSDGRRLSLELDPLDIVTLRLRRKQE